MRLTSKQISLLILAITAIACSRIVFALFDDPEGPNLLIVFVLAAIIYLVSSAAYLSRVAPWLVGFRRTLGVLGLQILVATAAYLAGRIF
jgi:hypothetical protein